MNTELRNANLADLAELLRSQQDIKLDCIVPATQMRAVDGAIEVDSLGVAESPDAETPGSFLPTAEADADLARGFQIPLPYLRRLRASNINLFDANINGWAGADPRSFLMRCFREPGEAQGILRAVLSDAYKRIDHLDVILGVLAAIRETGTAIEVKSADLSAERMVLRVYSPDVQAMAENLLRDYQNPFSALGGGGIGRYRPIRDAGGTEPVVFAGFRITNSETGDASCRLEPEITVKVCMNGLVVKADMIRAIHLGSRGDEGIVRYSEESEVLAMQLVQARTKDAVRTFLDEGYLRRVIESLEEKSGRVLANPSQTVKVVAQRLMFSEEEADSLLALFLAGGQMTAGGVMQATSALGQVVTNGDRASEVEAMAIEALETAYALA